MTQYDIRLTTYTDVREQATALFAEHWDELARHKSLMVLAPDDAKYMGLEAEGKFFSLAAYAGDELVGYSGTFIAQHIHYKHLRYAANDVIFITKNLRNSPLGLRLIRATEKEATRRGAHLMTWHCKTGSNMAELLPRMGCDPHEIMFSKALPTSNFQLRANCDITAATDELAQPENAALWDIFTARQDTPGSPHHDTKCIVLRAPNAEVLTHEVVFNCIESIDIMPNIDALPAVRELCKWACQALRVTQLGRVMLAQLKPGGSIDKHFDDGAYAGHFERFHIAITSDTGNEFTCGDETIHMLPGEMWKFNHRIDHQVQNNSDTPRIHLIIDAVTQEGV